MLSNFDNKYFVRIDMRAENTYLLHICFLGSIMNDGSFTTYLAQSVLTKKYVSPSRIDNAQKLVLSETTISRLIEEV